MAEFGTLNLEEMAGEDARLKEQGGSASFLDQFVPMPEVKAGQTGSVAIRLLPPVKGGKLFQYNRVHTLNSRKIHCPRPLVNGKWDRNVACPICDYYSSLWRQIDKLEKSGRGADAVGLKEEARQIKPVERYYYNAIVRSLVIEGKEKKNDGPRILSVGKLLHQSIIAAIVGREGDPDSKLGNVTDLKAGWDFIIRKQVTAGEEGYPKYDSSGFSRQPSPAGSPEEVKRWQENLHDLTKLRNPKDFEYLEKELAIHRNLIPDDAETFDTEGFDAKWKKQSSHEVDEEISRAVSATSDTAEHVVVESKQVVQSAPKASKASKAEKAEKVEKKAETLALEDQDFLRELEEMEG